MCYDYFQVPDTTLNGDEQIDAVVVDEDAVGAPDGNGDGAKILRGQGALDFFLGNLKRPSKVRATQVLMAGARCSSHMRNLFFRYMATVVHAQNFSVHCNCQDNITCRTRYLYHTRD